MVAEQQLLVTGGYPKPIIFAFSLPEMVFDAFKGHEPEPLAWVYAHGIRFTPTGSSALNKQMTDIEITIEE